MSAEARVPTALDEHLEARPSIEKRLDELIVAFATGTEDERRGACSALSSELLSHIESEELSLMPLLHSASPRTAAVIRQEHRHIRGRLKELEEAVGLPARRGLAQGFAAEVRAHLRSKEHLLASVGADCRALETVPHSR